MSLVVTVTGEGEGRNQGGKTKQNKKKKTQQKDKRRQGIQSSKGGEKDERRKKKAPERVGRQVNPWQREGEEKDVGDGKEMLPTPMLVEGQGSPTSSGPRQTPGSPEYGSPGHWHPRRTLATEGRRKRKADGRKKNKQAQAKGVPPMWSPPNPRIVPKKPPGHWRHSQRSPTEVVPPKTPELSPPLPLDIGNPRFCGGTQVPDGERASEGAPEHWCCPQTHKGVTEENCTLPKHTHTQAKKEGRR